jgi:hypothetical protein
MLGKVRGDLGILDDDSDLGETAGMGETVSTSSFKLRPTIIIFIFALFVTNLFRINYDVKHVHH